MAAADHLQPRQLSMFMPARQLYEMPSMDTTAFDDVDQMRRVKRSTNRMGYLPSHIAQHGVQTPVQIAHPGGDLDADLPRQGAWRSPAIANGNHRLIAQYDADPNAEVPVVHHDTGDEMWSSLQQQDAIKWRK